MAGRRRERTESGTMPQMAKKETNKNARGKGSAGSRPKARDRIAPRAAREGRAVPRIVCVRARSAWSRARAGQPARARAPRSLGPAGEESADRWKSAFATALAQRELRPFSGFWTFTSLSFPSEPRSGPLRPRRRRGAAADEAAAAETPLAS